MSKQWTPIIHQDYIYSLRHIVLDEDRYQLSLAIWDKLIEVDDPTAEATPAPDRPGRFTIKLMSYIITFEVPVNTKGKVLDDATEIRLLPIDTIK